MEVAGGLKIRTNFINVFEIKDFKRHLSRKFCRISFIVAKFFLELLF